MILTGTEAHHAATVLRLKPGNACVIFNGEGVELRAELTTVDSREVTYRVISQFTTPPLPVQLNLIQAVTKSKSFDLILQKTTEIGVGAIYPVWSDRSVSRFEGRRSDSKLEKWQQTVLEACKQCGRNQIPTVHEPTAVDDLLSQIQADPAPRLMASLQPDVQPLRQVLLNLEEVPKSIWYVVGPEGDFTPSELGKFRAGGFSPISLGPTVLRAETAAIYLTGVLAYECFDRSESGKS